MQQYKIPQIVPLRFILILMIFLHHLNLFPGGGAIGVSSFFILSGFCMTLGYSGTIVSSSFDEFNYFNYVKKRLIKFIPLHWICLLVVLLPSLFAHKLPDISILVSNITLLQSWIPIQDYYFSFNSLSWYLSDILFLSIVFPFLKPLFTTQTKNTPMYLFIGIYIILVVSVPVSMRHALLYINPMCRIFDFILGIWLAKHIMSIKKQNCFFLGKYKFIPDLIFLLSLTALVFLCSIVGEKHLPIAGIFWPFITTMIASIALMSDTPLSHFFSSKPIQILTQCTFSFYMIHCICRDYITRLMPDVPLSIRLATIFTITYLISQISYYCIEIKLNKQLQSWLIKSPQNQKSVTA